jgi:hypothetical protein
MTSDEQVIAESHSKRLHQGMCWIPLRVSGEVVTRIDTKWCPGGKPQFYADLGGRFYGPYTASYPLNGVILTGPEIVITPDYVKPPGGAEEVFGYPQGSLAPHVLIGIQTR